MAAVLSMVLLWVWRVSAELVCMVLRLNVSELGSGLRAATTGTGHLTASATIQTLRARLFPVVRCRLNWRHPIFLPAGPAVIG
jgi:hypothetical protein